MDCSLPGSSIHGILQARILDWVAMPSSKGSSRHRDQTWVSYVPCFGKQILYWQSYKRSPNVPVNLQMLFSVLIRKCQVLGTMLYHWSPGQGRRRGSWAGQLSCRQWGKAFIQHPVWGLQAVPSPCWGGRSQLAAASEQGPRPHPTFISEGAWRPGPSRASGFSFKLERCTCSKYQLG